MNITTRTGRRLAAAIVGCCAILLPGAALAAPATPSAPARAAAHAIVPGCETPGLVIWLDTRGNGGAGSVFYALKFTNLSGHTCTLNGFPFINAVSLNGFRVFPPNQTRAKVVPFPFGACSASGPVYLFVRPVTK